MIDWLVLTFRNRKSQHAVFLFTSDRPLSASSIGFVAGVFPECVENDQMLVMGAVDHAHLYNLTYSIHLSILLYVAMNVVEKATHYLDSVFTTELTNHSSLLSRITIAAVVDPPEPYCVCNNMIIIDRNELVGEKDYSRTCEFYHMICFCLAYQYYGILIQPLAWSDSWICIGVSSFLAIEFIGMVSYLIV